MIELEIKRFIQAIGLPSLHVLVQLEHLFFVVDPYINELI